MNKNAFLRILLLVLIPPCMAALCESEVDPHCHSEWKPGDPMPEFGGECHGTRTGGGADSADAGVGQ